MRVVMVVMVVKMMMLVNDSYPGVEDGGGDACW